MTLDLLFIVVLGGAPSSMPPLCRDGGRGWALLAGSVIGIYWLQPSLPIRFSSYHLADQHRAAHRATWWLTRPAPAGGCRAPMAIAKPRSARPNPKI